MRQAVEGKAAIGLGGACLAAQYSSAQGDFFQNQLCASQWLQGVSVHDGAGNVPLDGSGLREGREGNTRLGCARQAQRLAVGSVAVARDFKLRVTWQNTGELVSAVGRRGDGACARERHLRARHGLLADGIDHLPVEPVLRVGLRQQLHGQFVAPSRLNMDGSHSRFVPRRRNLDLRAAGREVFHAGAAVCSRLRGALVRAGEDDFGACQRCAQAARLHAHFQPGRAG